MDPSIPGFAPSGRGRLVVPICDMDNWYPTENGIRTLPGLVVSSNALGAAPNGSFVATAPSGGESIYAGTTNHLWQLIGGIWTIVDSGNLIPTKGRWRFAQFLSDVLAFDSLGTNVPQVSSNGGLFNTLSGSPPAAAIIATVDVGGVGTFAFVFNFNGFGDQYGTSGIGNDADWNFNIQTLGSSGRESAVPGPWTGAASLNSLMIAFKANGVAVFTFQGGQFPFYCQWISNEQGVRSHESIVNAGDFLAFVGNDNFYTVTGSGVFPIPNQLRDWFFKTLNGNYAANIIGEYDEQNAVVYWHFSSVNANPAGMIDTWIGWNPLSGRWTKGSEVVPGGPFATYGVLPFSTDLTWGEFGNEYLFPNYASPPAGLLWGSPSFNGSPLQYRGVIGGDGVLRVYSGAANGRTFMLTGDNGYMPRLTQVNRLMPKFKIFPNAPGGGTAAKLFTYIKDKLGDQSNPNQNGRLFKTVSMGPQGWCNFIENARWHRFKIEVTTDAELLGYELDAIDGGER
jgi:hypothetical protein